MESLSTRSQWGLAAILGCGLCCGGLLGNSVWLAGMVATLAGLAAGWMWLALAGATATTLLILWRRRTAARCQVPGDGPAEVAPDASD